jgi:hypothetical protein
MFYTIFRAKIMVISVFSFFNNFDALQESQLFKGEELKYQLGNVKLKTEFHGETAGRLFITNYQCLFVEDEIPHVSHYKPEVY